MMNFVDPRPEENWRAIGWTPNMVDRERDYMTVRMAPADFLAFVDPSFDPRAPVYRSESMRWLEEQVRSGRAFTPLQVWATKQEFEALSPPPYGEVRQHEGRHRALLAHKLGMEEIPVLLWHASALKAKLLR